MFQRIFKREVENGKRKYKSLPENRDVCVSQITELKSRFCDVVLAIYGYT